MGSTIRIIQYGIGPIGAAIVRLITKKENAEIVGAIDIDPAKAGQDLARVVGLEKDLGVVVSNNAEEVLRIPADIVVHSTASYLTDVQDQLTRCLAAGHNVVSSCEELSYPLRKYPEISRTLDDVAKQSGVTLHGTGVNPGFVMDKLALTLSSVCQSVERVSVTRIVDASKRRQPLQKKVGAGMSEKEFRAQVEAGRIKHHGLPESAGLIADGMNIEVDEIAETIEPVIATGDVTTEYLEVKRGEVAGVRQICKGTLRGEEKLHLELQMYVGAHDPADTVRIIGMPDLTLLIPGGTHGDLATVAAVVNAIPAVVQAQPGLKTVADIPVRYYGVF
ncbi:MAG: dihydrodipicolinate reductase [Pyrinomonadaceae bacterium]|nr:dihydrodipicolinate reductase [Pyrinomonadaceae bacterium]